jgi:hypothetical protein
MTVILYNYFGISAVVPIEPDDDSCRVSVVRILNEFYDRDWFVANKLVAYQID